WWRTRISASLPLIPSSPDWTRNFNGRNPPRRSATSVAPPPAFPGRGFSSANAAWRCLPSNIVPLDNGGLQGGLFAYVSTGTNRLARLATHLCYDKNAVPFRASTDRPE